METIGDCCKFPCNGIDVISGVLKVHIYAKLTYLMPFLRADVAVTGLPSKSTTAARNLDLCHKAQADIRVVSFRLLLEPRNDHAAVMAKFAADCLSKSRKVFSALAPKLGADTTKLDLRLGIHRSVSFLLVRRSAFYISPKTLNRLPSFLLVLQRFRHCRRASRRERALPTFWRHRQHCC